LTILLQTSSPSGASPSLSTTTMTTMNTPSCWKRYP
jgi:hypothetical protein